MTEVGLTKFKQTLKQASLTATKSRVAVFSSLQQLGPITVCGLVKDVGPKADRATVYRAVELFEKLGIINRVWHSAETLVELSEIFIPHHHHALCQNCGRAVDMTSSELESVLAALSKRYRFLALSHSVELSGYCDRCQN